MPPTDRATPTRVSRVGIVAVIGLLALAGCDDGLATDSGLRGTSLDGPHCPQPQTDGGAIVQPSPDTKVPRPTSLTLCTSNGRMYEITATNPDFEGLISALATPNPADPPSGCEDYADSPMSLVAETGDGNFLIYIPEDRCGHYNKEAKKTLLAAMPQSKD